MEEVIGKKLLHHILLISQADDEFMESILGIVLHNVPQNRPLANLDHGLGLQMLSSLIRVPNPPANITTFIWNVPPHSF